MCDTNARADAWHGNRLSNWQRLLEKETESRDCGTLLGHCFPWLNTPPWPRPRYTIMVWGGRQIHSKFHKTSQTLQTSFGGTETRWRTRHYENRYGSNLRFQEQLRQYATVCDSMRQYATVCDSMRQYATVAQSAQKIGGGQFGLRAWASPASSWSPELRGAHTVPMGTIQGGMQGLVCKKLARQRTGRQTQCTSWFRTSDIMGVLRSYVRIIFSVAYKE